ncbi:TPA: hypothetical protein ACRGKS_005490 [Klebsiella pneumoniae]
MSTFITIGMSVAGY